MQRTGAPHVLLDLTHREAELHPRAVPAHLRDVPAVRRGYRDASRRRWRPAAHYAMGGVRTDLDGRTSMRAACIAAGEVACTGVHGANRLASNSLLEGVVFGSARGAGHAGERPATEPGARHAAAKSAALATGRMLSPSEIQRIAWEKCGIVRVGGRLAGGRAAVGSAGAGVARGAQHAAGGAADRALRAGARREPRRALPHRLSRKRAPNSRGIRWSARMRMLRFR